MIVNQHEKSDFDNSFLFHFGISLLPKTLNLKKISREYVFIELIQNSLLAKLIENLPLNLR